ncbi:hypothetical protein I302_106141 [Kwoniella bestiolae CBS 10118]|uniref:Uncharacterized protein n=1 Tax=Kwoniella bestiolae CBS 10118 TaxID=1296100 RepID=A0A1B9G376_9TREE|nr:hypothetical protein I302_05264 [Kwoniella bestiolae CBS 10118]OCF25444.1 hypothetical protein I302_05264 [Kwoniella bestiolae CBS 10118]
MSLTRPTSQLPSAFRLVRQILSDTNAAQGLTTKELVKQALKIYQSENPHAAPSQSQSQAGSSTTAESSTRGKGKGKNVVAMTKKDKGVNVIPEGHPFVSTSHLKSQILARLQSQSLLLKLPLRPSTSSSPSSSGGKPTFVWRLNNPKQSNLTTPQWNYPGHWDSLISGEKTPGELYYEYNANKAARSEEEKQRGLDGGKVLRTEKEIWAWEGRVDGLTTNLERGHLNRRRRDGRPAKERRNLQGYEGLLGGAEVEGLEKQVA